MLMDSHYSAEEVSRNASKDMKDVLMVERKIYTELTIVGRLMLSKVLTKDDKLTYTDTAFGYALQFCPIPIGETTMFEVLGL